MPAKNVYNRLLAVQSNPDKGQQPVHFQSFTASEKTTRRTHLFLRAKRPDFPQLPEVFLCNALVSYEDNILTLVHELFTAGFDQ